jgi:hypothetical protein
MLTLHLLREGEGHARVMPTFARRMTFAELFEKVRPSQLVFCGTEPPTMTRHVDDDEEDSIRVRDAKAVFVCIHDDPRGTFEPGFYLLMGVEPSEVKSW